MKDKNKIETKDISEYWRMFREARDFDSTRFDNYEELAAYYEMQQDFLTTYSGDKPWVVDVKTPYASDAVDLRIASLLSNDYVGAIEPLSPEDVENVDLLNRAYATFWKEMNMDNYIREAIRQSSFLRETYTHVVFDEDEVVGGSKRKRKGSLTPYSVDPASIVISPEAQSLKTANYVFVVERVSKLQAKTMYPDVDFDDMSDSLSPQDRGEIYVGTDSETYQADVLSYLTCYEVVHLSKKKKEVYRTRILGNKIVEETVKLSIPVLPIAQLRWQKRTKSPYGLSLMDRLLGLQKSVNAMESAITNTGLAFAAPSFIISEDSGLDPEEIALSAGAPGVVVTVQGDPNSAIVPMFKNKTLDEQMLAIKAEQESAIYRMAGVTQEFRGTLGTAGNTRSGANDVMQRAKIIENNFLDNLEEYLEDLSNIVIMYIIHCFGGQTIYTRSEKKSSGDFKFDKFKLPKSNLLYTLQYTFYIDLDVRTPYSKEKNKQAVMELYQMENQYKAPIKIITMKDVLKALDIPAREEYIERYDKQEQQTNEMKVKLISEFVKMANDNGIDEPTIQQALNELLEGNETPTVDQVVSAIEQKALRAQQMQAAAEQQSMQQSMQTLGQQPGVVTGNEQFNLEEPNPQQTAVVAAPQNEVPVTGDEVFSL